MSAATKSGLVSVRLWLLVKNSLISTLVAMLFLVGCSLHHSDLSQRVTPPQWDREQFQRVDQRVCQPLASTSLAPLLQTLANDNLQLEGAWARVRQARANTHIIGAQRKPQVSVNAQASRSKTSPALQSPTQSAPSAADNREDAVLFNRYQLSLAAQYELDLWQGLSSEARAAEGRSLAQVAQARAMSISLGAELLEGWFDFGFAEQKRALLMRQLEIIRQLREVLKQRYLAGQVPVLDVLQQQQELEGLRASLTQIDAEHHRSRYRIAVLLGQSPVGYTPPPPQPLPKLPDSLGGLDLDTRVLAHRPDLQSAYHQLYAADADYAAAMAERWPSVSLSASLFDESTQLDLLGDDLFWRIAASLTQPLFSAGRIQGQIDFAQAAMDEAEFYYRRSLLTALQEVGVAWHSEQLTRERLEYLTHQQAQAEDAYQLAIEYYQRGSASYLRVLSALQSMISVQQRVLQSQRQALSLRIQFCRAIGVSWLPGQPISKAEDA